MIVWLLSTSNVFAEPSPVKMNVILERMYLDGEVSEEIREETVVSMKDIWKKYEGWQLVDMDDEQIVFQKTINDISPLLKANGYFGLTKNGTLSIFEGKPNKSSRVIQSFFQIDIKKLESRQHEQLKKGIRVISKSQYKDIIETYRHFALMP
ncbi:BofC C-terminal domain-containing protein [Thermaerobacillus caldiproteolyticus]